MHRDDCGVDSLRHDSFMSILAVLERHKSVLVSVAVWYLINSSQGYQYQHSGENCVFLDYSEVGGNKHFRNVGTYRPAFLKLFQVGTTFISQNVLQTTLLLSPLKANLSSF
jgi:hypothetical protein